MKINSHNCLDRDDSTTTRRTNKADNYFDTTYVTNRLH